MSRDQKPTAEKKPANAAETPSASAEVEGGPIASRDPHVRLMLQVREGDDEAFAKLLTAYQDRLIAVFYHMFGDRSAAEDLTQEVFLRVYRARHGYQPTAKFSTWLFRIANNLAQNSKRAKRRSKEVAFAGSDSGSLDGAELVQEESGMMPTRQLDKNELQHIVQSALANLNDRQRMAVLLHKFEEMNYADIGGTLEMSSTAVKSLLARARENLRSELEPYVR